MPERLRLIGLIERYSRHGVVLGLIWLWSTREPRAMSHGSSAAASVLAASRLFDRVEDARRVAYGDDVRRQVLADATPVLLLSRSGPESVALHGGVGTGIRLGR